MRRSTIGICSLLVIGCGGNAAINGPTVVDTNLGQDIPGDVTPADDTSLPDVAATETTSSGCTFSSDCATGSLCLAGQCVPQIACASDNQCKVSNTVCDTAVGICVDCLLDSDCATGENCKAHKCLPPATPCQTTKECAGALVCDKTAGICVECAAAADCAANMACVQSVCVPMACQPGAVKCTSASSMNTCAADGSGLISSTCSNDKTCVSDQCLPVLCAPNQKVCGGAIKVMLCNATGTALSQVDSCDGIKTVCLSGACTPTQCTPGAKSCADSATLAVCKADGTGYDSSPCGPGLACDGGTCVSVICKPLANFCVDNKVQVCNASGTNVTFGEDCGASNETCVNGACASKVCVPGSFTCNVKQLGTCAADGMSYSYKACDDGDACTTDACDTVKGCTATAISCDDGNVCTSDSCDKTSGCAHANAPGACDAGGCVSAGACLGGTCSASPVGTVGTIAGSGTAGYLDGAGSSAEFNGPRAMAITADGGLLVTEIGNQRIRKIDANGTVSTIAGSGGTGDLDGPAASAQFRQPIGILIASDGTMYVSEFQGHRIRKISGSGTVSTLAGSTSAQYGYVNGVGTDARFNTPMGMVFDAAGNILVAEIGNHAIRRVTPAGVVTTVAGGNAAATLDGPAAIAQFNQPMYMTYDPSGNLYISDFWDNRIRKLGLDGWVSTVLGDGSAGFGEGVGTSAKLAGPLGIVWHPAGFIVLNDGNGGRVRALWSDGSNATLAGNGTIGFVDGFGTSAVFNHPEGLVVRSDGNLAVSDGNGNRIRSLTLPTLTCNDTNPCTIDACDATTGKCTHTQAAATTACEDGNKCTSGETCDSGGKCTGGSAITCDDSQPCTDDSCDLISGKCLHGFNASACEDNNPCTIGTLCNAGGCGLPVFCDDGNPCTADSCSGGNCSHAAIANCCGTDAACDDGNGCTTDTCALTCDGTAWNGSCYKGLYANNTWTTAEQYCVSWGGHLASIASQAENTAVFGVATAACGANEAFIGLSDATIEGTYTWSDGSAVTWTGWNAAEPSHSPCTAGGVEDYGDFKGTTGGWNDLCAGVAEPCAVCEKPLPPGTCSHTPAASCCKADADCDDKNACTTDSCSNGTCQHVAIANCGGANSCVGNCGNQTSGGCWCDVTCSQGASGCCSDYASACNGGGSTQAQCLASNGGECSACTGTAASGCSCDPSSLDCTVDGTGSLGLCCKSALSCCP